ncbi:hypothetical protein RN001_008004 [Aquatica leii]|uniref:Uncharacterized protein n=1 Tax=Aquatica leii TaxID=1421715 RepID=A0AAN7QIR2_9COLE|nr:hypothetical protein RN001_008004 [Aquatica leii]
MKIKIAVFLSLACLLAVCYARPAEDYDYEEAPVAAAPKPAPRTSLLNRRNHLNRAPGPKTTSTTTPPPPAEEEDSVDEEEEPIEEVQPETSSTTEAGRRLKGGVVRPFRSNQDLLETLKKRREQAVINKTHAKTPSESHDSDAAPVEHEKQFSKPRPSNGRGRYNKKENAVISDEEPSSTAASRPSGRRFRN